MLVSELSACDADRMPSRSIVPVVTVARRPERPAGWSPRRWPPHRLVAAGPGRPSPAGRLSRSRPRRGTRWRAWASRCEAGVVDAVGEVEAGRTFGDQGPVPRPLASGDLATRGVEGEDGGAEVADRPGPLGLEPAAAGAGSCPARPRRGRPATASPRPARTAGRRARHRRWRGPARRGPVRAAGGPPRSGSGPGPPAAAASRPRRAAPGRPDRRRWRRRSRRRDARGEAPAGCRRTGRWGPPHPPRRSFRRAAQPPAIGSCRATGRPVRCRYVARTPDPPPPRRRSRPAMARSPAGSKRSGGSCMPALARSPPAISPSRAR